MPITLYYFLQKNEQLLTGYATFSYRSKSKESKESETVNKRLSRSLTSMFKNKPNIWNKLKGRKHSADTSGKPATLAVQNDTYQAGSIHSSESFEGMIIYLFIYLFDMI